MCGIVQGDDLVFAGSEAHLEGIAKHMASKSTVNFSMIGRDAIGELRVLSRGVNSLLTSAPQAASSMNTFTSMWADLPKSSDLGRVSRL